MVKSPFQGLDLVAVTVSSSMFLDLIDVNIYLHSVIKDLYISPPY